VKRRWTSFDKRITDREFLSLPLDDRVGLFEAMKLYRLEVGTGYIVQSYGHGLMALKPKSGQGRCLFFCIREVGGDQELVALLAYKKESQRMPVRFRELAFDRMREYKEKNT
jgi:hypothetical protein